MKSFLALCAVVMMAGLAAPAAAQNCPIGSYPSVDSWGNNICKRTGGGGTASVQAPSGGGCPIGSYPTVDRYGNQVCRQPGSSSRPQTDYYDTSKGCPIGSYPSVDSYGNKVCKRP